MSEPLTIYLAAPRGFCAGVDRAIKIVEMALEKWGAPVYVRHEIVHNKYVVDGLRDKGAIFSMTQPRSSTLFRRGSPRSWALIRRTFVMPPPTAKRL